MGYTKLFSDIIMSTVWQEPNHIRLVWITMLALKDRWHIVNASLPGLADSAKVTLEECEEAIRVLSSPDKYSRSTEYEGRRIKKVEGGWEILNGEKYRNRMSLDERREYQRIKQKEYREKRNRNNGCQEVVNTSVNSSQRFTHTDTDTDTDTDTKAIKAKTKSPAKADTSTETSTLNAEVTSPPTSTRSPPSPKAAWLWSCLDDFKTAYKFSFSKDYTPNIKRDLKLFKFLRDGGADRDSIRGCLEKFFSTDNKFKGNCDVPSFYKAFNRLTASEV